MNLSKSILIDMKKGFVYILTNKYNTVFYVGVTSDLTDRVHDHKNDTRSHFSRKYNLKKLVWFDEYPRIEDAIEREKQLKNWKREWKINLIKSLNPEFRDLYDEL